MRFTHFKTDLLNMSSLYDKSSCGSTLSSGIFVKLDRVRQIFKQITKMKNKPADNKLSGNGLVIS